MTKIALAPAMTAKEVLALVSARKCTKAQAIAYLQARVDAAIAKGVKPSWASRVAVAQLKGLDKPEALPEGLARKYAKAPAKAEPKAPVAKAKAAPKARKAKPAPAKQDDALTKAAQALAALDEVQMAAFLKTVFAARS